MHTQVQQQQTTKIQARMGALGGETHLDISLPHRCRTFGQVPVATSLLRENVSVCGGGDRQQYQLSHSLQPEHAGLPRSGSSLRPRPRPRSYPACENLYPGLRRPAQTCIHAFYTYEYDPSNP